MGFSKEPPAGDKFIKDPGTYGFGGSEPSTDKNAGYGVSNPADGVTSNEAEAGAPLWDNIDGSENTHTGNIRGQSPVSGLMPGSDVCNSNWAETSVLGEGIQYVGNNTTPKGTGAVGTLGAWPIKGAALNPSLSTSKGDAGLGQTDSWNDDAPVGSAASSWKGKGSGEDTSY